MFGRQEWLAIAFPSLSMRRLTGVHRLFAAEMADEVVVVSKEYYEKTKPNLKSVLLSHRFGERGDKFDEVLDRSQSYPRRRV